MTSASHLCVIAKLRGFSGAGPQRQWPLGVEVCAGAGVEGVARGVRVIIEVADRLKSS